MKVYKCNFQGYWPVGAAAVVVAEDRAQAQLLIEMRLAAIGLKQQVPIDSMEEIATSDPEVHILCDGDY